jgi:hypothetical protein
MALRYFLWVDGKIILREAEGYFTTKKTAKDLQSFLKRTDASLLNWRLKAVSEMHDHNGMDAVPKVLLGGRPCDSLSQASLQG